MDLARQNALREGLGNIEFRAGELSSIDCKEERFDCIVIEYARGTALQPDVYGASFALLEAGGSIVVHDLAVDDDAKSKSIINEVVFLFSNGRIRSAAEIEEMLGKIGYVDAILTAEEPLAETQLYRSVEGRLPLKEDRFKDLGSIARVVKVTAGKPA